MLKAINLVQHRLFQKQCNLLLEDQNIHFAEFLDNMGNLIAGKFKDGITPFHDEIARQKLYLKIVLRERILQDFDHDLGSVDFSVSRSSKINIFTFQFKENTLFMSTEVNVNLDKTAQKIRSVCEI